MPSTRDQVAIRLRSYATHVMELLAALIVVAFLNLIGWTGVKSAGLAPEHILNIAGLPAIDLHMLQLLLAVMGAT